MSRTVVVADDDSDIRALVAIAASRAGYDIVADVADGEAAIAAIRQHRPELAILDVSMPGMTGLDVCRLAREDDSLVGLRILMLSAAVDEASRQNGILAGADDYLTKPFSPRELVAWLTAVREDAG